jgi:toxin-antitoxin system PIN domain toxin
MIVIDTNILVYAHRADSPWHKAAYKHVQYLAQGNISWGIPWPCIHEFIAIVTHPKIYTPASPVEKAIDQIDAWLESPVAVLMSETTSHWEILKTQLRKGKIQGPMVHDARIAALCLGHGVVEFWSADRDFSRFSGLNIRNPLLKQ